MQFSLDVDQEKQITKWLKNHRKSCNGYAGAIGGEVSYKFIPTGLGMITVVNCICGEELNITDFSGW